jgi:tRNA(Ser,Leu) C12 N-acetylase TAN1
MGRLIYNTLQQPPEELHTLVEQQLIMETILSSGGEVDIDIDGLKKSASEIAKKVKKDEDYDKFEAELLKKHSRPLNQQEEVVDLGGVTTMDEEG